MTGKVEKTKAFVDDVDTWADSWQEHLGHIRNLSIQVRAVGLGINLGKSNFGKPHLLYLAHDTEYALSNLYSFVSTDRKSLPIFSAYIDAVRLSLMLFMTIVV